MKRDELGFVGISVFIAVIAFYIFSLFNVIFGMTDPVIEIYMLIISALLIVFLLSALLAWLTPKSFVGKNARRLVGFTIDCARY